MTQQDCDLCTTLTEQIKDGVSRLSAVGDNQSGMIGALPAWLPLVLMILKTFLDNYPQNNPKPSPTPGPVPNPTPPQD